MHYYKLNLHYSKREIDSFIILEDVRSFLLDLRAGLNEFKFDPYEVVHSDRYCCVSVSLLFSELTEPLKQSDFALFWRNGTVESFEFPIGV